MYLDQTEVNYGLVELLNSCDSQLVFTFSYLVTKARNICYAYLSFVHPSGERNINMLIENKVIFVLKHA